jgi:hypothetical protein
MNQPMPGIRAVFRNRANATTTPVRQCAPAASPIGCSRGAVRGAVQSAVLPAVLPLRELMPES